MFAFPSLLLEVPAMYDMKSFFKKKKKSKQLFHCAIPASVEAKGNGRKSWQRMKRCGHEHAKILEQSLVRHCSRGQRIKQ